MEISKDTCVYDNGTIAVIEIIHVLSCDGKA